jgi:hypothetical protein
LPHADPNGLELLAGTGASLRAEYLPAGALGVDGITKEQYGQDLERNLRELHGQMRAMRYRHQPIRRVHIPKDKGKTRPIGISCRGRCAKCWRRSTSRSSQTARTASGAGAARTTRFGPCTGCCMRGEYSAYSAYSASPAPLRAQRARAWA